MQTNQVDVLAMIRAVRALRRQARDAYPSEATATVCGREMSARVVYNANRRGSRVLYRLDGKPIAYISLLVEARESVAALARMGGAA